MEQSMIATLALQGIEARRSQLRTELQQLDAAEVELRDETGRRRPGRPRRNNGEAVAASAPSPKRGRPKMNAQARKRLSDSMKARWAAKRAQAPGKRKGAEK